MKKAIVMFLLSSLFIHVQAQEVYNSSGRKGEAQYAKNRTQKGFDPHRLIFGGGFSAGLSTGLFVGGISPLVGYKFSDRFSSGIRLGYQYQWIKNGQAAMDGVSGQIVYKNINYSIISGGVWARFIVWQNLFLHAEYEHNLFTYKKYFTTHQGIGSRRESDNAPSLLTGIGYRQPISSQVSFVIMVFYDVLQDIPANQRTDIYGNTYSISPYADRVDFRIGINVGF